MMEKLRMTKEYFWGARVYSKDRVIALQQVQMTLSETSTENKSEKSIRLCQMKQGLLRPRFS